MHSHESEQMTYVLQGALRFLIDGEEITVREGEVLHIPSWVPHQAEALDDTFEMDIFSPIRQDWLDGTDNYFHDKKSRSQSSVESVQSLVVLAAVACVGARWSCGGSAYCAIR